MRSSVAGATLVVFGVVMCAVLVEAQEEQCRCSKVEDRVCEVVQLVDIGAVDTCALVQAPCSECACDDNGDLACSYDTAVVYEFIDPFPSCSQTLEVRIATCPDTTPTPTPQEPPVVLDPPPTPTSVPTPSGQFREFQCATDQRVVWIPPLNCTIEADAFPPGAVIGGASMMILETANGTALFRNEKDTPANGTYQALIFQEITSSPAAGLFGDWPDVDTGANEVNMEPNTVFQEVIGLGPVPFPIPVSANFSTLAQSILIDSGSDIVLTLTADSLLTTSNDFTGSRLVSAFAKVDVTITVFFTA
eukprot:CAMPEP_0185849918 /NCGR_PEP_ID=MMETSP1354-20130828/4248_1 /TAXON_ID=708628 /ORGANISM="Erythrolobus madagascarensis, Strain CCMP3276" /LENGTH=304 /DNA_ID=CAMNT_0028550527 /DNA_START=282 /DNA_END=1196 /DNA_ORIENTATION=+